LLALRKHLTEFFFPASSDIWLAILRLGLGFQVTLYCLSLRSDWKHLFAGNGEGLISRDLMEAILTAEAPLIPRLGWLVTLGGHLGLSEAITLSILWSCLLVAGCCLLMGLFCRRCAILAWFLHLCAVFSGR